jgi:hypothetical protein
MSSVAGDESIGVSFYCSSENHVVCWVAGDGFRTPRPARPGYSDAFEEFAARANALAVEAEFQVQDAFELVENGIREDELKTSVDRLLKYSTRRPLRDERRNEHVRIAENAQAQARARRASSTRDSTSSGPIPRCSAR